MSTKIKRRACFSFHYANDAWRAGQVRNMGVVDGNEPVSDNAWEEVVKKGDDNIKKWINGQIEGRTVAIVLIGKDTADRKWVRYEIKRAWNEGLGVLGVYIHGLKDQDGNQSKKGRNPFESFSFKDGRKLSQVVKVYDPPYEYSKNVYDYIKGNIAKWTEDAINARKEA